MPIASWTMINLLVSSPRSVHRPLPIGSLPSNVHFPAGERNPCGVWSSPVAGSGTLDKPVGLDKVDGYMRQILEIPQPQTRAMCASGSTRDFIYRSVCISDRTEHGSIHTLEGSTPSRRPWLGPSKLCSSSCRRHCHAADRLTLVWLIPRDRRRLREQPRSTAAAPNLTRGARQLPLP